MKGKGLLLFLLGFAALWLALRLPWLGGDAGIPSMWEYGYNVTDEGYYLVGGKEKLLWGHFVDMPRAETATYGYAPGMHFLSYAAHKVFGLSDWKWRIPFVAINFAAWIVLFLALARRLRPLGAFLLCAAFSCIPMIVAYERTASNDVLIGSLLVMACVAAAGTERWRLFVPAFLVTPIMLIKPSMWALLPLVVCCVMTERKTRSRLIDVLLFAGSFAAAFALVMFSLHLVTIPDANANGVSVAEVLNRMNARYGLPNILDFAANFKGVSCFPRDPSGTMLGPLTLFLAPLPVFFFLRRISWRTAFGFFIPAYVGAVSIMNTIYTHYFIPVLMAVPLLWMFLAEERGDAEESNERPRNLLVVTALMVGAAFVLYLFLSSPARLDPAIQRAYSRIYNLPQDNVWTVSALPAVLFSLVVTAICAVCGYRKLGCRGLIASAGAALLVGSVAFALLPAVRIAPAMRVQSEIYVMPLLLSVTLGAILLVASSAFPLLTGKAWCAIPLAVVVVAYLLTPTWRAAAVELVRPATHYHRDAAKELAKLLPEDAIVLGERADQMLMSVPVRTSSTFLANSDGTKTAEDILKVKPDAKLYLMADTQHAYNLQNFAKKKDRFALQPLAKVKMPSFETGKPVDVHLCKIIVMDNSKNGRK